MAGLALEPGMGKKLPGALRALGSAKTILEQGSVGGGICRSAMSRYEML